MWKIFKDWCWWNLVIKRNEFHPSLNLNIKKILSGKTTLKKRN